MDRKTTLILVAVMLVLGMALGLLTSSLNPGPVNHSEPVSPPSELVMAAKLTVSFVNFFLILALLIIYLDIYSTTKSRFTLGLVVVIVALLVHAFTSNPIVHTFFGYPEGGAGPFLFIPDIFTALASGALLYLSVE